MTNNMMVKQGKRYVTRGGRIVGPMMIEDGKFWHDECDTYFLENGHCLEDDEWEGLVKQYKKWETLNRYKVNGVKYRLQVCDG